MTGVVTGHLGLRHLRLVVISVLLTVPLRADVVTSLTFRQEGIAPANMTSSEPDNSARAVQCPPRCRGLFQGVALPAI